MDHTKEQKIKPKILLFDSTASISDVSVLEMITNKYVAGIAFNTSEAEAELKRKKYAALAIDICAFEASADEKLPEYLAEKKKQGLEIIIYTKNSKKDTAKLGIQKDEHYDLYINKNPFNFQL